MSTCKKHKLKLLPLIVLPYSYIDVFCENCQKAVITKTRLVISDAIFFVSFFLIEIIVYNSATFVMWMQFIWFAISYILFRSAIYSYISYKNIRKSKKVL